MKKLLLFGLVSIFLVGCAGGPKAPKEQDQLAKEFRVPSDNTSNLYIYRNEMFGGAIDMDVLIDGNIIATTGPKTYILANLPAGKYKIEGLGGEGASILTVNLLPNSLKFIWQEVKMGVWMARNKLQEVSDYIGKKGVLDSQLLESKSYPLEQRITGELNNIYTDTVYSNLSKHSFYADKIKNSQKSKAIKSPRKIVKKQKVYYSSSCPCGYSYCYGPRGGRYCITSSGNKSYR